MRSRLAASVSPLSVGGKWRKNICKSIPRASSSTWEYAQVLTASKLDGLESSVRPVHASSVDDDFSELGPPVTKNGATQLKLATQKPERHHLKSNPVAKATANSHASTEERLSLKDKILEFNKFPQTSKAKLQDHSNASSSAIKQDDGSKVDVMMTINQEKSQKLHNSCSISIENVPSTVSLSDLVQAISMFGKVCGARMRGVRDGLDCCDIEFENLVSSNKAVLAGGIFIESSHLPICPLHSSEIVVVQIHGIAKKTTDPTVHSVCKSIGPLEGLAMDGKHAANAVFRVENSSELQRIVKRLNKTIIDDCCWSACQLQGNSAPITMSKKEDGKTKLGLRLNERLVEVKRELDFMKLNFLDLKLLHMGILHLQGHPTSIDD